MVPPEITTNPRSSALATDIAAGKDTLAFWQVIQAAGSPLIEEIKGDSQLRIETFLWRSGDGVHDVLCWRGGPADGLITLCSDWT